jgi:hypothetical protein
MMRLISRLAGLQFAGFLCGSLEERRQLMLLNSKYLLKISVSFFTAMIAIAITPSCWATGLTLQELLAKKVFQLNRPMIAFHYSRRPVQFKSPQEVATSLMRSTLNFYNPNVAQSNDAAGPGLYLAVDPVITREQFGGDTPQLFVVGLKQGTRIFDTRSGFSGEDEAQFTQVTKEMKCFDQGVAFDRLVNLRRSLSKPCRDATIQALKNLHVQAIVYDYEAATSISECRRTREVAFNVIDASAFDLKNIAYFSDTSATEAEFPLISFVSSLYAESSRDPRFVFRSEFKSPAPKTLPASKELSSVLYSSWKAKYIWSCGATREAEIGPLEKIKASQYFATESDGYLKTLSETKKAYQKKFLSGTPFSATYLRIILKQQFSLSGLPLTPQQFEDWRRARLLSHFGMYFEDPAWPQFKETAAQILSLVNETMPSDEQLQHLRNWQAHFTEVMTTTGSDVFGKNAGRWGSGFAASGFGTRFITILLSNKFEVPMILMMAPTDPNRDYLEIMNANRRVVIGILNHCKEEYLDPSISASKISDGPCGLLY